MRMIFLLCFCLGAVSCKTTTAQREAPVLIMEKTACLGKCPVYKVVISNNRRVHFYGSQFVPLEDTIEFKLSKKEFDLINEQINNAHFADLEDKYYKDNIHDLPTIYIKYYQNGELQKSIMDYYGAPERLKEFEKNIEEIIFCKL